VGYTWDNSFDTNETGLGETQPYMYPNAYFLDENMQSCHPIFRDRDRDIYIGTNNLRIRVTCEFLFSCQSKEEQMSLYGFIKNNIKDMYGYALEGISTDYVIPNVLINSMKNMLYGESAAMVDIEKDFDKYLYDKSGGGINPVYRNGKRQDKFYEMNYTYRRIYFKLSGKPVMDDGDKKDMVYDNYTIRFPAIVEMYIPINYVVRTPDLIPGAVGGVNAIGDFIVMDKESNDDNMMQVIPIIKKYKDTCSRSYVDKDRLKLIVRDEFAIVEPEDYYDLRIDMTAEDKFIFDSLTTEQRSKCYKILMFEGDAVLSDKYYYIDDWSIVRIREGNILKTQMIEIYVDPVMAANFFRENENTKGELKSNE